MYSFISFFAFSLVIFLGALFFFFATMACLSTGVGRVVLIGPCRRVSSMSRELAPSLRRVSLITLWHGGSSMFYAPQLLSCLSRVSDVCVCAHVCASGRLPSCQSSRTSLLLLRLSEDALIGYSDALLV